MGAVGSQSPYSGPPPTHPHTLDFSWLSLLTSYRELPFFIL